MKILVIGSGGREHALCWKLRESPLTERVYVAPGNAGTAGEPGVENVSLDVMDYDGQILFCREKEVGLVVVGPEAPLVAGIVDRFRGEGISCLGPMAAAARLEGSKIFAKDFMMRHGIPTANHATFTDLNEALLYLCQAAYPIVIKADGLAAGKGVVIAEDEDAAAAAVSGMLTDHKFGEAGSRVVIEDFLSGEEASFICLVDGRNILPMATSQDHKAAYDGDRGPNTGGMGAYSPASLVDKELTNRILKEIIHPVVEGMAKEGTPYTGFLYAGLMITPDRSPKVVEFNCRFGDPEAQPVLSRLRSDFASHCLAAAQGTLGQERAVWDSGVTLSVVMASKGYPENYDRGEEITGLDNLQEGIKVFHSGTRICDDRIVTDGGRVVCVTASGANVEAAKQEAYRGVSRIHWKGAWNRTDIGYRAIEREKRWNR